MAAWRFDCASSVSKAALLKWTDSKYLSKLLGLGDLLVGLLREVLLGLERAFRHDGGLGVMNNIRQCPSGFVSLEIRSS